MMKKTKAYKGGRKVGKVKPKLITDPKILDKMSDKEIANMLAAHGGLEGMGAKKAGGTVGRKAGKKVGTKGKSTQVQARKEYYKTKEDYLKSISTPASAKNRKMPYKKPAPKKKPKSMIEKQMDIVMPKQQTMKSGKRVGCGAALRGYGKAMGKK